MRTRGLVVAWVVSCTGCNAVLGVDDYAARPEDKGPSVSVTYVEEQCEACVTESCAAEERACRADKPCAELDACLANRPRDDLQGRTACYEEHDLAIEEAPARALDDCRRSNCLEKCLGTGGVITTLGEQCRRDIDQDQECIDTVTDCFGSYVCERKVAAYVACAEGPNNPACRYAALFDLLRPEDDAERKRVQNLAAEVRRRWPTHGGECGITEDFSCAGDYLWGNAAVSVKSVPFAVAAGYGDPFDQSKGLNPAANITVDACAPLGTAGCLPQESGTTDGEGMVELDLPLAAGRFDGHFFAHGANVYPVHFFPGRTLWRPVPRGAHSNDDVTIPIAPPLLLHTFLQEVAGTDLDESLGALVVTNYSCWRVLAGGLALSLDAGAETGSTFTTYYPPGNPTTASGGGVWAAVNIAPGLRELTSKFGQEVVVDRRPVPVAAGALTWLVLYPDTRENRASQ